MKISFTKAEIILLKDLTSFEKNIVEENLDGEAHEEYAADPQHKLDDMRNFPLLISICNKLEKLK